MHWGVGVGILGCFGTVQAAMYTTKDYKPIPGYVKGDLMNLHKSFGLLIGAAVVPRLAVRALSTAPAHLPGPYLLNLAADASHVLKYALMIAMPATGIAMGYFGGKGLPFFGYTIPGASAENKNGVAVASHADHVVPRPPRRQAGGAGLLAPQECGPDLRIYHTPARRRGRPARRQGPGHLPPDRPRPLLGLFAIALCGSSAARHLKRHLRPITAAEWHMGMRQLYTACSAFGLAARVST